MSGFPSLTFHLDFVVTQWFLSVHRRWVPGLFTVAVDAQTPYATGHSICITTFHPAPDCLGYLTQCKCRVNCSTALFKGIVTRKKLYMFTTGGFLK
jgi:hypothetical protein